MKMVTHFFGYCFMFWASANVLLAQTLDTTQRKILAAEINKRINAEQWQEAKNLLQSTLQTATQQHYNQDIAFAKYLEGIVMKSEDKLDSAIISLNTSIQIFDKNLNDDPNFAQKYTALASATLAACYHENYNYPFALDFYQKALKIYEIRQDKKALANLISDISLFYRDVGTFKTAFEYGFRALDLHQNLNDTPMVSYDLLNLAIFYDETGEYDKALEYYFKVVKTESGDLTTTYNNIASSYKNKKQYDQALAYAQKALENATKNKETDNLDLIEATFCEILFLKNKKDEALSHGLTSLKYGRENQNLEVVKAVALILSQLYEGRGEQVKAYALFKEHISARDSLNNEIKERDITRKLALYDFEAKQQEQLHEQLRKDAIASTEKKALYSGLGLMGLLAALIFRNFRRERKAKAEIAVEQQKSEELLLNILPKHVADELKARGAAEARSYEQVSVLFADFKDFTKVSEQVTPSELVELINKYFTEFDRIIGRLNLEKIKTIGDAYVCVGGLSDEDTTAAGVRLVQAAIEMQKFIQITKNQAITDKKPYFEQRIGISTGSVVAGIVGLKKFTYDIWGDTVNVAARMEQNCEAGKINISESTYQVIKEHFNCSYRGKVEAKNKGEINMYFIES